MANGRWKVMGKTIETKNNIETKSEKNLKQKNIFPIKICYKLNLYSLFSPNLNKDGIKTPIF